LGDHISPGGWNNWGNKSNEKTARYSEYQSTGPGAAPDKRVPWSHQLSDTDAAKYTIANILAGADNWDPTLTLPATTQK
jgi:pectinesterase